MFAWSRKQEPRLENWDGRRHSTRDSVSMMPCAWTKGLIARLGLVFLSACGLIGILFANSPPFPYRFGSTLPHDFRARIAFEVPNQAFTAHHLDAALDAEDADPDTVTGINSPPVDRYAANAILVRRGQKIDGPKLVLLMAEHRAYVESLRLADRAARLLSLGLLVMMLAVLLTVYVHRFQPALASSFVRIASVCALVFVSVGFALLLSRPPWDATIIPLTLMAMVVAIAYNHPFALLLSFCLSILLSIGEGTGLSMMLIHSGGLATAILMLREIRSRSRPVQVSALAGVAYLSLTVATGMLSDQPVRLFVIDGLRYFLWSLLAGFILCGSLPLVERCFGVMTDATLLELADSTHPLMQELVRRAPGTYTHSMTVATLAEAAAERINANTLLVRVGSLFHDIGKMLKPHYFIENQTGENRHDYLEPALSTLVIMGHVKDGVALARQYGLPKPIIELIQQHHGTTLVEYFYREARRLQQENGLCAGELEYAFRYPGPKPQTREAGILMLADATESASRALELPTPNSLRKLVHDLMMKRLLDSQFDECGLTMRELKQIEDSLAKSLIAVFHARIRYQEPKREVS
jgi:cyclic-di-AMP phosphodiesterase PgpH